MKTCTQCKQERPISEYHIDKGKHRAECKHCKNQKTRLWNKQNPHKKAKANKSWAQNNRDKKRKHTRLRRARQNQVKEHYTPADEQYTLHLFSHQCFKCGNKKELQIDHHYPLSLGYALTRKNAVVLCISCNSSKHNKLPEDYYTQEELTRIHLILCPYSEQK